MNSILFKTLLGALRALAAAIQEGDEAVDHERAHAP